MRYDLTIREIKINGICLHLFTGMNKIVPTFHRTCSVGQDHDIFQTQLELNIQVWAGMT